MSTRTKSTYQRYTETDLCKPWHSKTAAVRLPLQLGLRTYLGLHSVPSQQSTVKTTTTQCKPSMNHDQPADERAQTPVASPHIVDPVHRSAMGLGRLEPSLVATGSNLEVPVAWSQCDGIVPLQSPSTFLRLAAFASKASDPRALAARSRCSGSILILQRIRRAGHHGSAARPRSWQPVLRLSGLDCPWKSRTSDPIPKRLAP